MCGFCPETCLRARRFHSFASHSHLRAFLTLQVRRLAWWSSILHWAFARKICPADHPHVRGAGHVRPRADGRFPTLTVAARRDFPVDSEKHGVRPTVSVVAPRTKVHFASIFYLSRQVISELFVLRGCPLATNPLCGACRVFTTTSVFRWGGCVFPKHQVAIADS